MMMKTADGQCRWEEFAPGRLVYVPPYWAHRSINTGDEPLISLCMYPGDAGHNYGDIRTEGFPQRVFQTRRRDRDREIPAEFDPQGDARNAAMPIVTCRGLRPRDILHAPPAGRRTGRLHGWGRPGFLIRCRRRAGWRSIRTCPTRWRRSIAGTRFPHVRMMPPPIAPRS